MLLRRLSPPYRQDLLQRENTQSGWRGMGMEIQEGCLDQKNDRPERSARLIGNALRFRCAMPGESLRRRKGETRHPSRGCPHRMTGVLHNDILMRRRIATAEGNIDTVTTMRRADGRPCQLLTHGTRCDSVRGGRSRAPRFLRELNPHVTIRSQAQYYPVGIAQPAENQQRHERRCNCPLGSYHLHRT